VSPFKHNVKELSPVKKRMRYESLDAERSKDSIVNFSPMASFYNSPSIRKNLFSTELPGEDVSQFESPPHNLRSVVFPKIHSHKNIRVDESTKCKSDLSLLDSLKTMKIKIVNKKKTLHDY
jgi:hypothetical protein